MAAGREMYLALRLIAITNEPLEIG